MIWGVLGGHLNVPETANLLLGHLLYGLLVGAIALFSASISDSAATAAIIALAFTIGSWVLDFALAGQPGAARMDIATVADADAAQLRAGAPVGGPAAGDRRGDRRLCRAGGGVAASRRAAAHQARAVAGLHRHRCGRVRLGHAGHSIVRPQPRIGATRFPPPISGRSPSCASRCSSPFIWHRKTRAMSTCGATF